MEREFMKPIAQLIMTVPAVVFAANVIAAPAASAEAPDVLVKRVSTEVIDTVNTEVEVRSQVNMTRGEPITLNYRLTKTAQGWKIFDINVLGAWLVETYKSTFASEISKGGVDGLIKKLQDRNRQLAAKPLQ